MSMLISQRCARGVLIQTLIFGVALCSAHDARAQTAPIFEAPPKTETPAATGDALWSDALNDEAIQTVFQAPDTVQIAPETRATLGHALKWNYTLGTTLAPEISRPAAALVGARGVRFRVKTNAPTALEIWFQSEPLPDGKAPIRYTATIWVQGAQWQPIELDAARFVRSEGDNTQIADEIIWREDWRRIVRFGVRDVTNLWHKRLGQVSEKGAREVWLDALEVSTRPAANAMVPVVVAPQPAPADDQNAQDDFVPPGFNGPPAQEPVPDNGAFANARQITPEEERRAPPPRPIAVLGEDDNDDNADTAQDTDAVPETPTITLQQDAWGAPENWIPINGQTVAKPGERAGLTWQYVRLGNRDNLLFSTVNASLLNFPPESMNPPPRDAGVVLRIESERLARVVLDISSQAATRLNVSLYERGGGVYSQTVVLDPRRSRQRVTLYLAKFQREQTTRDTNNQLDLSQIDAIVLDDTGAQKGFAGPNQIGLFGVSWMY